MELHVNQTVLYQGFKYKVLWIYGDGQCEIENDFYHKLVKISELTILKEQTVK